jgi:hypothetical protein
MNANINQLKFVGVRFLFLAVSGLSLVTGGATETTDPGWYFP